MPIINIVYVTIRKKSRWRPQRSDNLARDETHPLDEDRVRCNDRFTPDVRRQFFSVFVKTFTSKQGARKFPERSWDIFLLSRARGNVVCTRRRYFHNIKWTYEILPRVATPRAIVVRGKRGHRCFLFKPDEIIGPFRARNLHRRLLNSTLLCQLNISKYQDWLYPWSRTTRYSRGIRDMKRRVTILQSEIE